MEATIADNDRDAHRLFRRSFFATPASSEHGILPTGRNRTPTFTEGFLLDPAVGGAPVVASVRGLDGDSQSGQWSN